MLNEKAAGKFGGMNKGIKSQSRKGSESDKCCDYDKDYHYPSGEGCKHGFSGRKGQEQHKNTDGIKHFRPSKG